MKRNIITIDQNLCNGCGACVDGCHEGALQIIDGKAHIISELYCDGLGACIGECPVGAITIHEREALPYDEVAVMDRISANGEKTILAHLNHLKDHNQMEFFRQGLEYVKQHDLKVDLSMFQVEEPVVGLDSSVARAKPNLACGCPGSMERSFKVAALPDFAPMSESHNSPSQLTHWPVQLHLLNPQSSHFLGQDLILAADCTAFAYADFHGKLLRGKKLAIACPKLDSNKQVYEEKIVSLIDSSHINTLTVVIMEVPCCGGLIKIAQSAAEKATRKVPIKQIVISVDGNIRSEKWI